VRLGGQVGRFDDPVGDAVHREHVRGAVYDDETPTVLLREVRHDPHGGPVFGREVIVSRRHLGTDEGHGDPEDAHGFAHHRRQCST